MRIAANLLDTLIVTVDGQRRPSNNARMNDDERKRVGGKLRALRREKKEWTQQFVADQIGISVNTLKSIEYGDRQNLESNVEALAKFYGRTLTKLRLLHEPIESDDPKLRGLKDEDIEIAHAFHHASTEAKRRVRDLVLPDEDDHIAGLVNRIAALKSVVVHELEQIVATEEDKMRADREKKKKRREWTD